MPQSSNKRTALVSGATGFIGAHVVEELLRAGHEVRVIGRRSSPHLARGVEEFVFPELTDTHAIQPAFVGAHWVVHLAGLAHGTRNRTGDPLLEYRRANVEVTRAFAQAAVAAGTSAFVLLSSVAALEKDADWGDATGRRRAAYSRSKRKAEEVLIDTASSSEMRPIVIRAPMVYGPNMKGNPLRLFRLIDREVPLPLGGIRNQRSSVYVGNLTAAIRFALEKEFARGIVHVADADLLSTPDFIRLGAESLGVAPRLFTVPIWTLKLLGNIGDVANRFVHFPVTSEGIDRLTGSIVLDTAAPNGLSGFKCPFTAAYGIEVTGEWFKTRDGE